MKLSIKKLKEIEVSETVAEYMAAHGTNHQLLLDSWKAEETAQFGSELNLLTSCLAYAVQQQTPKVAVIKRIKGRISKVRHAVETEEFNLFFNPMASIDFLK